MKPTNHFVSYPIPNYEAYKTTIHLVSYPIPNYEAYKTIGKLPNPKL